jgi:GTP-binding protein
MPGYGYAAVAKSVRILGELGDYLRGRPSLLRVFVLVDGRHGLKRTIMKPMRVRRRRRPLAGRTRRATK